MKDLSNFEHVTSANLHRASYNITTAIENEDSLVAILALAGIIGNLANRFRVPEEVVEYAHQVSLAAVLDLSPLTDCKTGTAN